MNKILLIEPYLPYPLKTGGHQAVYSEIKVLSGQYDLIVAYQDWVVDEKSIAELKKKFPNVEVCPLQRKKSWTIPGVFKRVVRKVKSKFLKNLPKVKYERDLSFLNAGIESDFVNHICEILERENICAIICEFACSLPLIAYLPKDKKKVFVHHEIRFTRIQRLLETQKLSSKRYDSLYQALKNEEIDFLNSFDSVVTFSEIDSKKLVSAGVTPPVYTSFFSVNHSDEAFVDYPPRNIISFVGPQVHEPNFFGLVEFLERNWNGIIEKNKNIELHVFGRWEENVVKTLSSKYAGVHFFGYVEDLKKALAGSVMIVPIDIGSGIRTKILDAAFMGIPVIATMTGVEGIPLENGMECIVVENISKLGPAVISLMGKVEFRRELARNAYKKVKEVYSDRRLLETRLAAIGS